MPSNRRRRRRQWIGLSELQWAFLTDDFARSEEINLFESLFILGKYEEEAKKLWDKYREDVLEYWIGKFPGTRPACWWAFDAPRIPEGKFPGCYYDGKLPVPRFRIGGAGNAPWDAGLAYVPNFKYGLPWCQWVGFDPKDPPVFESEAEYLVRNRLLARGEKAQLKKADFRHVQVEYDPRSDLGSHRRRDLPRIQAQEQRKGLASAGPHREPTPSAVSDRTQ